MRKSDLHVRKGEEALLVEFDHGKLFANGVDAAAKQLGTQLLQTLHIWDKAFLDGVDTGAVLSIPTKLSHFELALELIEQSVRLKSPYLIPAIERYLNTSDGSPESADFLRDEWPRIRLELSDYEDN